MFALLDGDEAIFKAAVVTEDDVDWDGDGESVRRPGTFEECRRALDNIVRGWCNAVLADFEFQEFTFVLSPTDRLLFRRHMDPTYKSGRAPKPEHYAALEAYAREAYPITEFPGLEADDTMGILQGPGKIIVSQDKDMKTVPGDLYITSKKLKTKITRERADWWWMMQTLMGDSTDGFPGCTGCGPKTAEAVLADGRNLKDWWPDIERQFLLPKVGRYKHFAPQNADDALLQAKLSRILRPGEYDQKTGDVSYQVAHHNISFNAHNDRK
jgi:DNA polymerase-1